MGRIAGSGWLGARARGRRRGLRGVVLGVAAGLVTALLPVLPGLGASPAAAVAAFGQPVLGDPVTVGRFGASNGGAPASTSCAPYVVTALRGYQHFSSDSAWLDGLVPTCTALLSDGTAASLGASAEGPLYGVATASPAATATTCPSGSVATGLEGRDGLLVDQVRLVCSPLRADGTLGAAAPAADFTGGTGGGDALPLSCPARSVVTGLTGRTGDSLDNLALVCRSLDFVRDTALRFTSGSGDGRVAVPYAFGSTPPANDLILSADVRWDGTAGRAGVVSQPVADGATTFQGWTLGVENGRPCLFLQLDQTVFRSTCAPTVLTAGAWTHLEATFSDTAVTVTAGSTTVSTAGTDGKSVAFGAAVPPLLVGRFFAGDAASGFGGDIDNVKVARDWGEGYVQTLVSMSFDEGAGETTTATVPGNVSEGGTLQGDLLGTPLPAWVDRTTADDQPENTTWVTAATLTSGTPVAGALRAPGEARWYKLPVNPDGTVTVDLTQLPADYDVTLFKDIGQAFKSLTTPSDLNTLSAEFAGDAFAPSIFSPSIFSPSIFSPSIFSPSIFSPSIFSPSIFSPSIFSPSIFSPSIFSPSIFSPDAYSPSIFSPSIFSPSIFSPSIFSPSIFSPDTFSAAWSSAQTRSIVGYSARDGLADENASAATWDNTGFFYVRVVGRNGAYAPDAPYRLSATFAGGACDTPLSTYSDLDLGTFPSGSPTTVVLTDTGRIPAGDRTAFSASVASLAGATDGVVVDLAASPRVTALANQAAGASQLACPYAKNLVAQAARDLVNRYRSTDGAPGALKYVVLAGGDDVVPFFRYPDQSGLGPENGYVPPVKDASAAQASLRRNTFLSQDAYGARVDVSVKGADLPVPDVAVGRLVETPAQIEATIAQYVGGTRTISPTSSLTTGYDFLEDAANAVHGTLQAGIGGTANDTLIEKQGVDPVVSWDAKALRDKLFGAKHDVVYLAGHFSANSALAADYTTQVVTTEIADKVVTQNNPDFFRNTLVVSAGCHSGYNLQDQDGVPSLTLGLDWAEAFAASGATLVAGTGYQYGDTDFLEYSERLYADFMVQLRTGTTAVPIGSALLAAKQQYLAETPVMRGIHTKALLESTLYGLPMLGMDMPNKVTPPDAVSTVGVAPVTGGPGAVLGLQTGDLGLTLTSASFQRPMNSTDGTTLVASYLEGPDGVVTNPAEPTLPLTRTDVTVPGQVLRGIGWRSGTYTDADGQIPLTGAATTETNAPHAPFTSSAFYPPRLATGNWFGAVADPANGRTTVSVTGAQYRSDGGKNGSGVPTTRRRTFGALGLELFYSNNIRTYGGNTPALSAPPMISGIDATTTDGATSVPVSVHVTGDPSAGVQKVWVTYTGTDGTPFYGEWASVDLTQSTTDSTLWTGEIPLPAGQTPGSVRFLVQAVNGVGLVSADDNGGEYWTPGRTAPVVAGTLIQQPSQLTLTTAPTTGVTGATVAATARLTSSTAGDLTGRPVRFTLGASTVTGTTAAGGSVTVTIPVLDAPGDVSLQAAFDGDAAAGGQAAAKTAVATVSVTKVPTSLALSPVAPVTVKAATATPSGITATLTAGGLPLRQKTVWFEVTAADGSVQGVSRITGLDGRVALGDVTLPAGTATVRAVFGGTVTLPKSATGPATTTSLADPTYAASTASGTIRSGTAPAFGGTPPDGQVAKPYTFTVTATGDPAPTVTRTGTLPPGLTFANGVLSGTPTTEGSFTFTLTATNGISPDATLTTTVTIAKAAPRTATAASGNGQVGTAGQPFDKPLVTKVVDAVGAPVAGVPVAYRVTSGPASFRTATGTASTVTVTTDAQGLATSPALLAGSTAGAVTVSAVAGTTATGTASTTFTGSVVLIGNARSDLAVTISPAAPSVARNGTFTATVTVRNNGPNTAAALVTGVTAGSPLTVVSAPGATNIKGVWTWTASGLPVGGTATYTITLKASTTRTGTAALAAAAASLVPDPALANNAAAVTVRIT